MAPSLVGANHAVPQLVSGCTGARDRVFLYSVVSAGYRALTLAKVIESSEKPSWIGGNTQVVQLGDLVQ